MLKALFEPKTVAVIGASPKEQNLGNRIVKNLLEFGFTGRIYPVNPKVSELLGLQVYPAMTEVPTDVDVAHIVIPAAQVPQAIEACADKNVKFVILNGGGFAEVGPEGAVLQAECLERARQRGIRILGPNCQGVINTDRAIRAYCNFTFTRPEVGVVSIVALSGGVGELIHQAFAEMGVGTRLYASNGNACDVSIPEILQYYGEDEATRVIVLYVEGLRDPQAFMKAAAEVVAKKPVLAMKAGRTAEGVQAAASHTGGLAREDVVTDLIFEKLGVLCFRDEAELCQAAAAFACQPVPRGNRVGVITNTAGPAVIATDVLVGAGLQVPALAAETKAALKSRLYPQATVRNPIDVLATAGVEHFKAALETLMGETQIDSVFVNFVTPFFVDTDSIAHEIVAVNQARHKPVVCNLMTDRRRWMETVRILKDGGVPAYGFPGTAARVLAALTRYHELRTRASGVVKTFADVDRGRAEHLLGAAQKTGRKRLSAVEAYGVLEAYGLPSAAWRLAQSAAEAEQAAAEIGFPVVVKANAAGIVHKTERGGVALNLADRQAVRAAVEKMQAALRSRVEAEPLTFFVQQDLPGGREVILGAKAEAGVGHLIMFGLGGIYVEIMKDVVFKLAPVTAVEAREMLAAIKAAPLLKGVRGEKGVDEDGLVELIQRLSQLVTELPAIQEMDLNPVIAYPERVLIADARISL
ncbi:MAG: acetate--CoA ligase family protein [Acidobacteria bacterium]|nr:acetate--CoA ligase family protein [Acidobacteriota bacterium]